MDSMGEVYKKSDAAERAQDKRILEQQLQKDREAEKADKQKKDRARQQNIKMLEALDKQINEKQRLKEIEMQNNQKYIKMVINQDESEKKKQRDDEARAAAKRKQVQKEQMLQMAGVTSPDKASSDVASSLNSMLRRKGVNVGSHMSIEELRINKGILKEISRKKKEGMGSQEGQSVFSGGLFSPNK